MTFSEILHALRTQHHVTQEQLAEATLVSRRSVAAWEHGEKLPSFDSIIALACYFKIPADDLLGLSESSHTDKR